MDGQEKYADALTWKFERPKGKSVVKPVPHPDDLIAAIDSLPMEKHRVLMKLQLFLGLRWNEVRLLLWENVDLSAGTIRITETDNEQDYCTIPLPLAEWFKANCKPSGYVFEGQSIGKPDSK